jgi:hypothetical protein
MDSSPMDFDLRGVDRGLCSGNVQQICLPRNFFNLQKSQMAYGTQKKQQYLTVLEKSKKR